MLQLAHEGRESTYRKHCFCLRGLLYWEQAHSALVLTSSDILRDHLLLTTASYFPTLEPHISSLACSPLGWWPRPTTHFAAQVVVMASIMLTRACYLTEPFPPCYKMMYIVSLFAQETEFLPQDKGVSVCLLIT